MEFKPKKNILLLYPDTFDHVKQSINLGKAGEMEDAIKTLKEWVYKQPHFKRKDFCDSLLQSAIIASKGSIEASKQKIDRICTLRTLMPDTFKCFDARKDFEHVFRNIQITVLPRLTKEHYRIFTVKVNGSVESSQVTDAMKYTLLIGDYMKACDCIAEFVAVFDLSEVNSMVDLITSLNVVHLRNSLTVCFEGHGLRLKGLYFITTSRVIDTLITILKQLLKPKIIQRIKIFKSWDDVHDTIGKDVLPVDFGGYEKSEQEVHDEWINALCDEDFRKYLKELNSATVDESSRPSCKFIEEYAGMPGTFRLLSVD
ncbi:unnamed protein product [Leptosia nina]|uniref:CRAL-TRIO domain-containing protein n=1 Tax=Leptosia nina TaxID=320188 RepID=A0AAV1IXR7_9NEOP